MSEPDRSEAKVLKRSNDIGLDGGDCIPGVGGRILEIRKEKSRDAARSRRGKENYEFYELAKLLPLPAAITSQLDKASIIRLSISYLKLRDFSGHGDPPWNTEQPLSSKAVKEAQRRRGSIGVALELFEIHQGAHILQSLDGFAFTLSNDGRFLYISETVSIYLGLSQVEMAGSSIFEYVHSQDHQELADQLGLAMINVPPMSASSSPSPDSPTTPGATTPPLVDRAYHMSPTSDKDKCFCIRMKSTLTKRGVHTRSSGYRVVQINGHFRQQINFGMAPKDSVPVLGLVAIAIALPPPTITELRLESDTFIMRMSPALKITYCENVSSVLTDWKCEDTIGRDLYSFCHPGDIMLLRKSHIDMLAKGQVLTPSIRLLCKRGGYVWAMICATSLYGSKTSDDQTVLAIIYVLSGMEHIRCPLDVSQMVNSDTYISDQTDRSDNSLNSTGATTEDPDQQSTCDMDTVITDIGTSGSNKLYRHHSMDVDRHRENGGVARASVDGDLDACKGDGKVSRRKTDRPRKRRRNSTDDSSVCDSVTCDRQESLFEDTTHLRDDLDLMNVTTSGGGSSRHCSSDNNSPDANHLDVAGSQVPEDLSMRLTLDKNGNLNEQGKLNKDSSADSMTAQQTLITSSMQELQKVVDRHLPSTSANKSLAFGTDTGEDLSGFHKHNSTIQWIGSNQAPVTSDTLSAATILRQLYTSRESVIRSNSRPLADGTSIAPSSEHFKDQLQLHIPQICNSQSSYDADLPVSMSIASANSFNMAHLSSASLGNKYGPHFQENSMGDACTGLFESPHANLPSRKCGKMQTFPVNLADDDMLLRMAHLPAHRFSQPLATGDVNRSSPVTGRLMPADIYNARPPQPSTWYELTG